MFGTSWCQRVNEVGAELWDRTHSVTAKAFIAGEGGTGIHEHQGLNSQVVHAVGAWQGDGDTPAVCLMLRAGTFVARDGESREGNRSAGTRCLCRAGEQKWKTMKSALVIVSLFVRLSPPQPFASPFHTLP